MIMYLKAPLLDLSGVSIEYMIEYMYFHYALEYVLSIGSYLPTIIVVVLYYLQCYTVGRHVLVGRRYSEYDTHTALPVRLYCCRSTTGTCSTSTAGVQNGVLVQYGTSLRTAVYTEQDMYSNASTWVLAPYAAG